MTNEEALDELNVIYERLSHPEDCEQGVYSFRDGNYLEALSINPDSPARQALDIANEILDFYNKDMYNQ